MSDKYRIILEYENGVNFNMTCKFNDEDNITIISMDENGHIASLWDNIEDVCKTFFAEKLSTVGDAMKS